MTPSTISGAPDLRTKVLRAFSEHFRGAPAVVARAPGRVNLIGDHTDYNDGFVLPMAIDRATWIAARPRQDRQVVVYSLDFDEQRTFMLGDDSHRADGWIEYLRGVAWALNDAGHPLSVGWDGVCAGTVPRGAGLSSSASLELATARAFAGTNGIAWDATAMARIAQRAENAWVGVNCGIMDQLISAVGVAGHALLIDCRSLHTRAVPIPPAAVFVVLDTATRRGLVDSAYNERRVQCETAARLIGARSLRDVTPERLDGAGDTLDPITRRRAAHVVSENARTTAAADALGRGNLETVGRLMNESHASLRDDFEVSRPELDLMVELAHRHPGCLGARMTGAGFGGCAVALVEHGAAVDFAEQVSAAYQNRTSLRPSAYLCTPSAGASLSSVSDSGQN